MFNQTCYHVKCWTSELCIPAKKTNLAAKLKMMLVNPVGDDTRTWPEILESAVPQETRITESELERFDGNIMNKLKAMYNLERNREELSERIYDLPLDKQVS